LINYITRIWTGPDSVNRKIFRAAVVVSALGVVARGGAAVRELVVAHAFGRDDALDAYLIAFLVPSFATSLVMNALGTSLIPTFVETRQKKGLESAQALFSSVLVASLVVLTGIALLLGLTAHWYLPHLASSFPPAKLHLTEQILYLLLPFVVFNGISTLVASVLNAGERFALPALVPLVTPLVSILFIVLAAVRWGGFALAAGAVLGSLLEAMILVPSLKSQGLRLIPEWNGLQPEVRAVFAQYLPMIAGSFLMSGAGIVDQAMAAMLPSGSVAALSYANKIVTFFLMVTTPAVAIPVLPYLSKMATEKDWAGCRHTLKRYSALAWGITLPLTLVLMIFSGPIVRILFQRGAFTAADTILVAKVQFFYVLQIPFYVVGALFLRFLSAVKRNDLLMYGAAGNLALDIVLNLILMRYWGIAGIALSTSLVYAFSCAFTIIWSIRILSRERSGAVNNLQLE